LAARLARGRDPTADDAALAWSIEAVGASSWRHDPTAMTRIAIVEKLDGKSVEWIEQVSDK
jgi:hypothetical protein